MNTYIEILAAPWDIGGFGEDGAYANNAGDAVRVELVRAEDSAKIVLGPLVVSWDGRLISTHVFVLPSVQPNAQHWNDLRAEFRIPLRVVVGGRADSLSNADTVYIVRPYANADQITARTNNPDVWKIGEALIGGALRSVRSRRGAIIVENLILEGAGTTPPRRYDVSTLDCDTLTPGNQGYLPFVLLSNGVIDGGGAILSANAVGKNGGAGGGGGGGQVCDGPGGTSAAMNGGDGYTGGASGGLNNIGLGASRWDNQGGEGSGQKQVPPPPSLGLLDMSVFRTLGGNGMSGVLGGRSREAPNAAGPEAAGGGTGHPFGVSGWVNFSANPAATAGGGAGRGNRINGDGGGYGVAGYSFATAAGGGNGFGGGQRHGNESVVPIAGGSGGASGNPQGVSVCGGAGGGGGGALRIAARAVRNLRLEAKGEPGQIGTFSITGQGPSGGAGSGGHIGVQSRQDAEDVRADVATATVVPGLSDLARQYLGAGRMRFDTPNRIRQVTPLENPLRNPNGAQDTIYRTYSGVTLSPQTQVVSPYTVPNSIQGFSGASGAVRLYQRTERGAWEIGGNLPFLAGGTPDRNSAVAFSTIFTPLRPEPLVEQDSLLFVVTAQEFFAQTNPFNFEVNPLWILSQTGAHILRIVPLPLIDYSVSTSAAVNFPALERCGAETVSSATAIVIYNRRGGALRVDSLQFDNPLFRLDANLAFPLTIQQNDSVRIPIRFTATADFSADSAFARGAVRIFHNDTIPDVGNIRRANPQAFTLVAPVRTIRFRLGANIAFNQNEAVIDFGAVAVGASADTVIVLANQSRDAVRYEVSAQFPLASAPFLFAERSLVSDTVLVRVRFSPDRAGAASPQTAIIRVSGLGRCAGDTASYRVSFRGVGTLPQLDLPNTDSVVVFTLVQVCYPDSARAQTEATIASAGNDVLTVSAQMAANPSLFRLSPSAFSLVPNLERRIRIDFVAPPTTASLTIYRDTLIVRTNDPRPEAATRRIPVSIQVGSAAASVVIEPANRTLDFGDARYRIASRQTLVITNTGNAPITVNLDALRSAPFRIAQPASSSLSLAPGARDSIVAEIFVTENFPEGAALRDTLRLRFADVPSPCLLQPIAVALQGTPRGPTATEARLWLDTLREVNMLRDTVIRIYGRTLSPPLNREDDLRASFRIRRGMFFPRSARSNFGAVTLDTNRAQDSDRIVSLLIPRVRLTENVAIVAEIFGTPIATDVARSGVEWLPAPATRWSRGDSVYVMSASDFGDGLLATTAFVQPNGALRLPNNAPRRATSAIIAAYPLPAAESLTLIFHADESGEYSARLVNMLGATVLHQVISRAEKSGVSMPKKGGAPQARGDEISAATLVLPLSHIPEGVYSLILVLPSGKCDVALVVVRR
jgi:hypothetical protein